MLKFEEIYHRAAEHKGGVAALERLLTPVPEKAAITTLDESRFLAEMTRCIFQAGFSWKVIDQKWDGFEAVFHGFDVHTILALAPEAWEEIRADARIVRNNQKIVSVRANAQFIEDVAIEHGSFAGLIADWPESDLIGLLELLKRRGSRLGGNTGQRFLRNVGKDSFFLGKDVVRCLQNAGVSIKPSPSGKGEMRAIQDAFNQWHAESGLPYTHLSKVAAYSISD